MKRTVEEKKMMVEREDKLVLEMKSIRQIFV